MKGEELYQELDQELDQELHLSLSAERCLHAQCFTTTDTVGMKQIWPACSLLLCERALFSMLSWPNPVLGKRKHQNQKAGRSLYPWSLETTTTSFKHHTGDFSHFSFAVFSFFSRLHSNGCLVARGNYIWPTVKHLAWFDCPVGNTSPVKRQDLCVSHHWPRDQLMDCAKTWASDCSRSGFKRSICWAGVSQRLRFWNGSRYMTAAHNRHI